MTNFPEWPLATELMLLVFLESENGDYRAIRKRDFRKPITVFSEIHEGAQLLSTEKELEQIGEMDTHLVYEWLELQDFAFNSSADAKQFFEELKRQFTTSVSKRKLKKD